MFPLSHPFTYNYLLRSTHKCRKCVKMLYLLFYYCFHEFHDVSLYCYFYCNCITTIIHTSLTILTTTITICISYIVIINICIIEMLLGIIYIHIINCDAMFYYSFLRAYKHIKIMFKDICFSSELLNLKNPSKF